MRTRAIPAKTLLHIRNGPQNVDMSGWPHILESGRYQAQYVIVACKDVRPPSNEILRAWWIQEDVQAAGWRAGRMREIKAKTNEPHLEHDYASSSSVQRFSGAVETLECRICPREASHIPAREDVLKGPDIRDLTSRHNGQAKAGDFHGISLLLVKG